jgi:hypothetical protein
MSALVSWCTNPTAGGGVRVEAHTDFLQIRAGCLSEDRTMRFRRIGAYVAVFVSLSGTVVAEEVATVQSLIKQGFAIVGTIASHTSGGGVYLQKKDQVFFCYVEETPSSVAVTTRYCKPVQ